MRIGLVKFLNARPLDYGLRQMAQTNPKYILTENIPSQLASLLLNQTLDIAMISTIEYLRNKKSLNMLPNMGICASTKADSLFYIRRKQGEPNSDPAKPVNIIYADHGSRSTIALLRLLYKRHNKCEPEIFECAPEEIPQKLDHSNGGLLIGDAALKFRASPNSNQFWIEDLASWWYREEKLPFVFAVWAYHKNYHFDPAIFTKSLEMGEANLEQISQESVNFPDALNYLKNILYYHINDKENQSIKRFELLCNEYNIL